MLYHHGSREHAENLERIEHLSGCQIITLRTSADGQIVLVDYPVQKVMYPCPRKDVFMTHTPEF